MYELGLGIALGKEAIIVIQEQQLPFDLRHWRMVKYQPDRMDDL